MGNPAFASQFNKTVKSSVRIANIHDPIPLAFDNPFYPPPFTKNGLRYRHVRRRFPLSYQLNSMFRNHTISCYLKIREKRIRFSPQLYARRIQVFARIQAAAAFSKAPAAAAAANAVANENNPDVSSANLMKTNDRLNFEGTQIRCLQIINYEFSMFGPTVRG